MGSDVLVGVGCVPNEVPVTVIPSVLTAKPDGVAVAGSSVSSTTAVSVAASAYVVVFVIMEAYVVCGLEKSGGSLAPWHSKFVFEMASDVASRIFNGSVRLPGPHQRIPIWLSVLMHPPPSRALRQGVTTTGSASTILSSLPTVTILAPSGEGKPGREGL